MRKSLIIVIVIIAAILIYFLATPRQQRHKDSEYANNAAATQQADQEKPAVDTLLPYVNIYYYAANDATCAKPVPIKFTDINLHKSLADIAAINALLTRPAPEGYKTALIPGTVLNSFKVSNGTAYFDTSIFLTLSDGPCAFPARKQQILLTLEQFQYNYKTIVLMVDGKEVK